MVSLFSGKDPSSLSMLDGGSECALEMTHNDQAGIVVFNLLRAKHLKACFSLLCEFHPMRSQAAGVELASVRGASISRERSDLGESGRNRGTSAKVCLASSNRNKTVSRETQLASKDYYFVAEFREAHMVRSYAQTSEPISERNQTSARRRFFSRIRSMKYGVPMADELDNLRRCQLDDFKP